MGFLFAREELRWQASIIVCGIFRLESGYHKRCMHTVRGRYGWVEALGSSASGGVNSRTSYNIMALHPGNKITAVSICQMREGRCGRADGGVVVRFIAKYIPGDFVASQPLRAKFSLCQLKELWASLPDGERCC